MKMSPFIRKENFLVMHTDHYYRAIFKYNPNWGYWYRENFYGRVPGQGSETVYYTVKTNSVGARTSREPEGHLSGNNIKKIMFVGCSYTAGDGVSNNERFSDLLETMVADVQCHNYALSGSGHDQQNLIHKHFAPRIKPDVLILSPYTGCLGRNTLANRPAQDPLTGLMVLRPKPYYEIHGGELVLFQSPTPRRSLQVGVHPEDHRKKGALTALKKLARKITNQFVLDWYSSHRWPVNELYLHENSYPYRLGQSILENTLMSSEASLKIIMPLPTYRDCLEINRSAYRHFYSELALKTDAIFIDCLPVIASRPRHELDALFSPGDGHYTHLGHEVVAAHLASQMPQYL